MKNKIIENLLNKLDIKNKHIIELEKKLLEAKITNNALIEAITNKDTDIVIYNGDIYKISDLTYNKTAGNRDTLELELIKENNIVSYNGGLVEIMNEAINNVGKTLNNVLYGDKTNKED